MLRSLLTPVLAGAVMVAVACEAAPTGPDALQPSFAAVHSTSDVFTFANDLVDGWSKVTRNTRGASLTIHTSDLVPGNAYTVWVVIFNEPAGCEDGCDGDDLFNPAAVVDVVYLAGGVVGGQGTSTFSGHRAAGDNSNSLFAALGAPAPGLIDPMAAEMHLIVRDHGPAIPGQIPAQIHTFQGACTAASSFGLGDGPNACEDVQFSVHLP